MDLSPLLGTAAEDLYALAQVVVAMLLGGLIGLEREVSRKRAGLRTHMLVAIGSVLFVKIAVFATATTASALEPGLVEADPVRIVQAIVIGISFLGTGVIFRDDSDAQVHGLTTAATLLTVAPIGVAVALEHYVLAVGATGIVLLVLRGVNILEERFFDKD